MFHTEFSFFWPFLNHSVSVRMFCWSELDVMKTVRMLHLCAVLFKQRTIQLWHHERAEWRKCFMVMINLLSPILSGIIHPFSQYQQQPPPAVLWKGRGTGARLVPSLQLFNGSLWMLPSSPPLPSLRQPIQGVSHGTPTQQLLHKALLSLSPHWHAFTVMCIREGLSSSTAPKGTEESGWGGRGAKCGFLETGFIRRKRQQHAHVFVGVCVWRWQWVSNHYVRKR